MKKRTKNLITNIIGIVMMLLGVYMIWIEKDIEYIFLMFGLGSVSFISFNELGDIFKDSLNFILRNNKK